MKKEKKQRTCEKFKGGKRKYCLKSDGGQAQGKDQAQSRKSKK